MGFKVAMMVFVAAVLVSSSMAESQNWVRLGQQSLVVISKPNETGTHNKVFYVLRMATVKENNTVNETAVADAPVLMAANGLTTILAQEKRQAAAAAASGNGAASASASSGGAASAAAAGRVRRGGGNGSGYGFGGRMTR